MDITSSIAALSVEMSMQQTAQAVEISVLKKGMETQEAAALSLIQQMAPQQAAPSFGHLLNTYA